MTELPGSGWIVEHGIGEKRALRVEGDRVLAARLFWPGEPFAGQMTFAKLVSRHSGAKRGIARTEDGLELQLDRLPKDAAEGSLVPVVVTRASIAERGRFKMAQGRLVQSGDEAAQKDHDVFLLGDTVRQFPPGLWESVWDDAWSGEIEFDGGSLLFSVTPAMLLIDVDGRGSPRELALAAVPAIASALRRFDIGGSIGIDFPTIADKAGRRAVDDALGEALAGWAHERTAMNGFGFVQIVARLTGPSLLHRMATSRIGAAARMALRRAERVGEPGALKLRVHPAVEAKLKPQWLVELTRRTGRQVRVETDASLAIGAGFAQAVSP